MTDMHIGFNPRRRAKVKGTSTPWGVSQTKEIICRGIINYTTAGHGGYHVSETLLKTMPVCAQESAYAPRGWFEEDCDWCKVVLCFPQYFSEENRAMAIRTASHYCPQVLAALSITA